MDLMTPIRFCSSAPQVYMIFILLTHVFIITHLDMRRLCKNKRKSRKKLLKKMQIVT